MPVRTDGDLNRETVGSGEGELSDDACRGDPPDPVADHLREPEIAVRPGGDPSGGTAGGGEGKLRDDTRRGDSPDLVALRRSEEHTSELQSLRHIGCRL